MNPATDTLLITISEAALMLRVSRSTIHRMIQDGELRRVTIRGCTRIVKSSVACHIDG